ncbi:MAG: toxin-antitoxin system CcdB family toxin component [Roseibaca calidilacus]|jgi:toxin CcdB|uniref:Toxin CcdB n=1 Tax=Roseibaca calidilacus TaxID=1666912 RepID=A0A0P7WIF8_9RHOB|nr:CcdB family protein [Roseibaca calidilacus]KPP90355.1 MAG: toxin-antitoxin system CcdB family toxin component [Roseibaca calidilacus]CUX80736.1 toxin CcdB [Roseibaca calidilacus]
MAQYDVFQNPDGSGYLLDVQSDLLGELSTRLVIPLLPASQAPKPATRLNPIMRIGDEPHIMVTQFMAAVPERLLTSHVTRAAAMRDDITAAIDMLTHGF